MAKGRGTLAQSQHNITNRVVAQQAFLLAGIRKRFYEPPELTPGQVDWNAVRLMVEQSADDPVIRAQVNAQVRPILEQMLQAVQAEFDQSTQLQTEQPNG